MNNVLSIELEKFHDDLRTFTGKEFNPDRVELLMGRFKSYEEAKIDYITGVIQSVEKRCNSCDYSSVKGETFFDKADYYIWQRTKLAKWFIAAVSSFLVGLLVYLFLNNAQATERNYQLLLRIDKTLTVSVQKIEINSTRIDKLEERVFNQNHERKLYAN